MKTAEEFFAELEKIQKRELWHTAFAKNHRNVEMAKEAKAQKYELLEQYAKEHAQKIAETQRDKCFDAVAGINIHTDAYNERGELDFKKVINLILNTPLVTNT